MKKPAPNPISDATRAAAARLWETFPLMKPVGAARQGKHLAELEALLAVVPERELTLMIRDMAKSKYTRQWVASFASIAEHLPQIRIATASYAVLTPQRQSYTARWQEENEK